MKTPLLNFVIVLHLAALLPATGFGQTGGTSPADELRGEAKRLIAEVDDENKRRDLTELLVRIESGDFRSYELERAVPEIADRAVVPILLLGMYTKPGEIRSLGEIVTALTLQEPPDHHRSSVAARKSGNPQSVWWLWWQRNKDSYEVVDLGRDLAPYLDAEIDAAIGRESDKRLRARLLKIATELRTGRPQLAPNLAYIRSRAIVPILIRGLISSDHWHGVDKIAETLSTITRQDLRLAHGRSRPAQVKLIQQWASWWRANGAAFVITPYRSLSKTALETEIALLLDRLGAGNGIRARSSVENSGPIDLALSAELSGDRLPAEIGALIEIGQASLDALDARTEISSNFVTNWLLALREFEAQGILKNARARALDEDASLWRRTYYAMVEAARRSDEAVVLLSQLFLEFAREPGIKGTELGEAQLNALAILRDVRAEAAVRAGLGSSLSNLRVAAAGAAFRIPIEDATRLVASVIATATNQEERTALLALFLQSFDRTGLALVISWLEQNLDANEKDSLQVTQRLDRITQKDFFYQAQLTAANRMQREQSSAAEKPPQDATRRHGEFAKEAARRYISWWRSDGRAWLERESTATVTPAPAALSKAEAVVMSLVRQLDDAMTAPAAAYELEKRGPEALAVLRREHQKAMARIGSATGASRGVVLDSNAAILLAALEGEPHPAFRRLAAPTPADVAELLTSRDANAWQQGLFAIQFSAEEIVPYRDLINKALLLTLVERLWGDERASQQLVESVAMIGVQLGDKADLKMFRRYFELSDAPLSVRAPLLAAIGACGGRAEIALLYSLLGPSGSKLPDDEAKRLEEAKAADDHYQAERIENFAWRKHHVSVIAGLLELAARNPQLLLAIESHLGDDDSDAVGATAMVMKVFNRRSAADPIATLLAKDHPTRVVAQLLDVIKVLGRDSHVDRVLPYLEHRDYNLRHSAVGALATIGSAATVAALWKAAAEVPTGPNAKYSGGVMKMIRRDVWQAVAAIDAQEAWKAYQGTSQKPEDWTASPHLHARFLEVLEKKGVAAAAAKLDELGLRASLVPTAARRNGPAAVAMLLDEMEQGLKLDRLGRSSTHNSPWNLQWLTYTNVGFPILPSQLESNERAHDVVQAWRAWYRANHGRSQRQWFGDYLTRKKLQPLPIVKGRDDRQLVAACAELLASSDPLMRAGAVRELGSEITHDRLRLLAEHLARERDPRLQQEVIEFVTAGIGESYQFSTHVIAAGIGGQPLFMPHVHMSRAMLEALDAKQ